MPFSILKPFLSLVQMRKNMFYLLKYLLTGVETINYDLLINMKKNPYRTFKLLMVMDTGELLLLFIAICRKFLALIMLEHQLANPFQTQAYVDPQMNLLPIGATGELYVGGDGVARGYLNRPELTQENLLKILLAVIRMRDFIARVI